MKLSPALWLISTAILLTACVKVSPVCSADALICPDGSSVSRSGPSCEFAKCPETGSTFKQYISQDTAQCDIILYACESGEPFSDESGCGCIMEHTAQNSACTKEYNPVCGWASERIQCFAFPCAQTYGNLCTAATDWNVAYTTQGECPKTEEGGVVNSEKRYIKSDSNCFIDFMCIQGTTPFKDEIGCGCQGTFTDEP